MGSTAPPSRIPGTHIPFQTARDRKGFQGTDAEPDILPVRSRDVAYIKLIFSEGIYIEGKPRSCRPQLPQCLLAGEPVFSLLVLELVLELFLELALELHPGDPIELGEVIPEHHKSDIRRDIVLVASEVVVAMACPHADPSGDTLEAFVFARKMTTLGGGPLGS
ncbi:hypothetical protein NUW58_g1334 [Xylaria curta]|uniref:Uncharacterized protein n=1 Tax=Xylaria curta TaxID=42375 RepID=A0ACC1PNK5_9PEZI|nr:hypothetical protein NUW58_g1334 [Xylaria curta]